MKLVREWEDTSRFGHLGKAQTTRANIARVVEYFSDSYEDQREAVYKAEVFLLINDYLARHITWFAGKELVEKQAGEIFSVEPALLRSVHHVFTVASQPELVDPKRVLLLARAFEQIEAPV
jgi:hypothetical protein